MPRFRVDYVTTEGERGEWHSEIEANNASKVESDVFKERIHIAKELKRNSDKILKHLIIVKLSETDIRTIAI